MTTCASSISPRTPCMTPVRMMSVASQNGQAIVPRIPILTDQTDTRHRAPSQ